MRRLDADRVQRDENSPFDLFPHLQDKSNRRRGNPNGRHGGTGPGATFQPLERCQAMTNETLAHSPRLLTPDQRKARDQARRADAEQAMREHEAAQKAFYANKERLKAERLAREAQARGRQRA